MPRLVGSVGKRVQPGQCQRDIRAFWCQAARAIEVSFRLFVAATAQVGKPEVGMAYRISRRQLDDLLELGFRLRQLIAPQEPEAR